MICDCVRCGRKMSNLIEFRKKVKAFGRDSSWRLDSNICCECHVKNHPESVRCTDELSQALKEIVDEVAKQNLIRI